MSLDQIDLGRYIAILWRYRLIIAAVTLIAGGVGFSLAITATRVYEAFVVLSASGSKLGEANSSVPTANFRPVIENRALAQRVVEKFQLDQPPYKYTADSFLEEATQLDDIRGTNLLRLSVRLQNPVSAAVVANALAEAAVGYAARISEDEGGRARESIKLELDRAVERFRVASDALDAFNRSAQLELATADVQALVNQRKSIPALVTDVESGRASVAQGQRELAERQKIDVTTKSVTEDATMLEATRTVAAAGQAPLTLNMKSESISESYEALDKQAATKRVELAGLERQLQELAGVRKADAATLAKIRTFHQKQAEFARLTLERTIAEKTYSDMAERYAGARLQVAMHSAELQIIDPAIPRSRPVSRQVVTNTFVALLAGFAFAAACALLLGVWRERFATAAEARQK